MTDHTSAHSQQAAERFHRSRRRATLNELLDLVQGRSPAELLSFDAVQTALKAWQQVEQRQPELIPLDKIVGSVGRYRDFTREFLPRAAIDEFRWRGVDAAMHGLTGLPAIEVYQIGEVYFVRDGNHRVSVALANGLKDIEAYVTIVETPVLITVDTKAEDLAMKAAYADFLRQTRLDMLRPDADLEVTELASYHELLEHIAVHRYYLGLEQQREVSCEEAVESWFDRVYLPVAAAIWASDIMERFPNRTVTDFYLWVSRYREDIARSSGDLPVPVAAVTSLSESVPETQAARVVSTVKRALSPKSARSDLAAEAVEAAQSAPVAEE